MAANNRDPEAYFYNNRGDFHILLEICGKLVEKNVDLGSRGSLPTVFELSLSLSLNDLLKPMMHKGVNIKMHTPVRGMVHEIESLLELQDPSHPYHEDWVGDDSFAERLTFLQKTLEMLLRNKNNKLKNSAVKQIDAPVGLWVNGAEVTEQDNDEYRTPKTGLEWAVRKGLPYLVDLMLESGCDKRTGSPLYFCLNYLVFLKIGHDEAGNDPHNMIPHEDDGGDEDCIIEDLSTRKAFLLKTAASLIESKADPNTEHPSPNPESPDQPKTPLQMAVQARDIQLIGLLLEAGADPNVGNILANAVQRCSFPLGGEDSGSEELVYWEGVIDCLLGENVTVAPNLNVAVNNRADPPYRLALQTMNLGLFTKLMRKGAGLPPSLLHQTLEKLCRITDEKSDEHAFTVALSKVLISNPIVDVNLSLEGVEPLELAVKALNRELLKELVIKGAYLRSQEAGNPLFAVLIPLRPAIMEGVVKTKQLCSKMADFLIEKGADPHILHQVFDYLAYEEEDEEDAMNEAIQFFAKKGASTKLEYTDPKTFLEDQGTILHRMATLKYGKIVHGLVETGANVRGKRQIDGCTPLHLATLAGDAPVVKILQEGGSDANDANDAGETSLHWAVWTMNLDVLGLLLQPKYNKPQLENADHLGRTPLHTCLLSSHSSDPNLASVVDSLLKAKADVNIPGLNGITPCAQACASAGIPEILTVCGIKGASLGCPRGVDAASFTGQTPFCYAVARRDLTVLKAVMGTQGKRGILHPIVMKSFAKHGFLDGLELCKEKIKPVPSDMNPRDMFGHALWWAVYYGRLSIVEWLLEAPQNANPLIRDDYGRGVFHWVSAWHSTNPDLAAALLGPILERAATKEDGVSSSKDSDGFTPLHWAATFRLAPVCTVLFQHGAKVGSVDKEGRPPINVYTCVGGAGCASAIKQRMPIPDEFNPEDLDGAELGKLCEEAKCFFYDEEFPPGRRSLSNGKAPWDGDYWLPDDAVYKQVEWRRSSDLETRPMCVVGSEGAYETGRITRGAEAGPVDFFVLSMMQGMMPVNCEEFFIDKKFTKSGMYRLKLPSPSGGYVEVVVDDYIPAVEGEPAFVGLGPGRALWPVLLRKALAKLYGGYTAHPIMYQMEGSEATPWFRPPAPDESYALLQGQLAALEKRFGSASNPIDFPEERVFTKASAGTALPLRSYIGTMPGERPAWHSWLPQNPVYIVDPNAKEISFTKDSEQEEGVVSVVVILMVSRPLLTDKERASQQEIDTREKEEAEADQRDPNLWRKVGSAFSQSPSLDEEYAPYGHALAGSEVTPALEAEGKHARGTPWEYVGAYMSNMREQEPFSLEMGCAYAFTAFEPDCSAGLWGAKPADWGHIGVGITPRSF